MFKGHFPAWEDQYGRMAIECTGKSLGAFHTQIDPAIFYSRNGRLRNAGKFGELALAQLLEFAQDTYGLSNRNFNSFFRR